MSSSQPDLAPVRAGEVLAGKYRVERVLGVGGMGVVVAAHHLQLDQKVALKFLLPQMMSNPDIVRRFEREARAAAKIKSEHVARVIDVGTLDGGAPYMVMEYLDGGDLADWLEQRGAPAVEQAVDFVLQACEAIAEAHAMGIIHRDLKPANLFCVGRPDGTLSIKVLDFGISKISGLNNSADRGLTRTNSIVGSPFYMSPEQMQSSKGVDERTDIWALGVILFELLTNRLPFEADEIPELIIKVLGDAPPLVSAFRSDVPSGLERVVMRCLTKDRTKRYASVAELAFELVKFASLRGRHSVEVVSGIARGVGHLPGASALRAPVAPQAVALTIATWGRTGAEPGQATGGPRRWVLAVALAAGTLLAVLYKLEASRIGRGSDPPPGVSAQGRKRNVFETRQPAADLAVNREGAEQDAGAAGPRWADPEVAPVLTRPATVTPAVAPTPAPSTKPGCNPDYYYDSPGNRVFKLECLP